MKRSWQSHLYIAALRLFGKPYQRRLLSHPHAPAAARAHIERLGAHLRHRLADVHIDCDDADGVAGEWISLPESPSDRTLLYFHGGGFMFRFPHLHRALAASLCRLTGVRVFLPDYALAPEQPFPQAVKDGVTVYRWLRNRGQAPDRLIIGGDSAGGGLVLSILIALRDAGEPLPAGAVALSPPVDLTASGRSLYTHRRLDPLFTIDVLLMLKNSYLQGALPHHPWASPLYADLRGLPPLLIQVGGRELLLDDARRLTDEYRRAGGVVELQIWDHLPHVFQIADFLPESRQALAHIARFIHTWAPEAPAHPKALGR